MATMNLAEKSGRVIFGGNFGIKLLILSLMGLNSSADGVCSFTSIRVALKMQNNDSVVVLVRIQQHSRVTSGLAKNS
jgi:hypothetical protein